MALNTAFGFVRTRSTRPEASLDIADLELEQDRFPAPDECLEATQDLHRLHAAIDLLVELEKALVTLYLDDRSYQEIAEILGISTSNVGVKRHSAVVWFSRRDELPFSMEILRGRTERIAIIASTPWATCGSTASISRGPEIDTT